MTQLENVTAKEHSKTESEYMVATEELRNENMLLSYKIAHLTRENQRLEGELKVFKFYAEENKALRISLNSMSAQLMKLTQLSQLESENLIKEIENWKRELDREYSERVRDNAQQAWLVAKSKKKEFDEIDKAGMEQVLSALKNLSVTPLSSRPNSRGAKSFRSGSAHNLDLLQQRSLQNTMDHSKTLQLLYYRLEMMQGELNRYKKLYKNERKRLSVGQSLSIWNSKFSAQDPVDRNEDSDDESDDDDESENNNSPLYSESMDDGQQQSRPQGEHSLMESPTAANSEGEDLTKSTPLTSSNNNNNNTKQTRQQLNSTGKQLKASRKSWVTEREEKERRISVLSKGRRILLP